ncbi:MAG: NAD(P)-dependent oxidoreductase [Chitinophagaceae bacterium]
MSGKIIITAPVHSFLLETLQQKGYQCVYEPEITYEALYAIVGDVVGLIVTTRLKMDATLLEHANQLKWIGRLGSGMELIDVAYAEKKGIQCVSSPEGNRTTVGEHTLGLLLSLMNRIPSSYEEIKAGQWLRSSNRADELTGKTVGIIGFGNTGAAFAKVLQGFDVQILAHDIYKDVASSKNDFGQMRPASLQEVQEQSDIISVHLPLTSLTRHYVNDDFFKACLKKPYFLSTCRGAVTDTFSVLHALQNQWVKGVGLDVLENEAIQSYTTEEQSLMNELYKFPQFILTPHIAGYSQEAYLKMAKVVLEKLAII